MNLILQFSKRYLESRKQNPFSNCFLFAFAKMSTVCWGDFDEIHLWYCWVFCDDARMLTINWYKSKSFQDLCVSQNSFCFLFLLQSTWGYPLPLNRYFETILQSLLWWKKIIFIELVCNTVWTFMPPKSKIMSVTSCWKWAQPVWKNREMTVSVCGSSQIELMIIFFGSFTVVFFCLESSNTVVSGWICMIFVRIHSASGAEGAKLNIDVQNGEPADQPGVSHPLSHNLFLSP